MATTALTPRKVTMQQLDALATNAADVFDQVRLAISSPDPKKKSPSFTSQVIADLCKIDKHTMRYLAEKHNLPTGTKVEGSKAKTFTLAETIAWVHSLGGYPKRPARKRGKVICVSNYKGGVAKTSTSVGLAHAMTLRGQKVLFIDLDGQGTGTQLCGIGPEDVAFEETVMPFIDGDQPDLFYAVQQSYWENLSVIPASSSLLGAEFSLPLKAVNQKGFKFWEVLATGLEPLRDEFDVIILDTSPSLSHLVFNAMFAADGLIMPCPPEALDFASSVQFWGVFTELATKLPGVVGKTYDFVTIVNTKVQSNDISRLIKSWMKKAYGDVINSIEIPESSAAKLASAQFKTIYDLDKAEGSVEAYKRYKEPLDRLADYALEQLAESWNQP